MFRMEVLQNDEVRYANQPIAVVIAETLEAATEGAALLAPRYETLPARVGLDAGESFVPPVVGVGNPTENHRGDVEAGLAAADKQIDAIYETPPQYHNAMEPHAIVAALGRRQLSIDTPTQGLAMASLARIAGLFGIAPDKIHIRSPFLGGGFGSKGLMAGPQCSASWRPSWSAGRSSSCCAVSRCMARSAIARRRGSACASAPTARGA